MDAWVNLFFFCIGGVLIGMGVMRMRIERTPTLVSSVVLLIGVFNVCSNGALLADRLGLINGYL